MSTEIGMTQRDLPRARRDAIELGAAFVLGLATITSTWCAYEAKAWSARQINVMLGGARSNTELIEETTRATGAVVIDVVTFMQYATAREQGDHALQNFVHARMRPEFARSFDEWLALGPSDEMPEGSPFTLPSYQLPLEGDRREQLNAVAALRMDQASRCNAISTTYVLLTVLLSTSLFFMGIATRFELPRLRTSLFLAGAAVWLGSAISAASLPVALTWVLPASGVEDAQPHSKP